MSRRILDELRSLTKGFLPRALTPYSGRPQAAAVLLSTGEWTAGVRIESASFSLVIPATLNALTTAAAAGRSDIVAAVTAAPVSQSDELILGLSPICTLTRRDDYSFARQNDLPDPSPGPLIPSVRVPASAQEGIEMARSTAARAVVPSSRFQVGAIAVTASGNAISGVNVEHPEWPFVLCAERNAVGTIVTHDLGPLEAVYLSCVRDPLGTPCGACRQILAELAPSAALWMDRRPADSECATPAELLPRSFTGTALLTRRADG